MTDSIGAVRYRSIAQKKHTPDDGHESTPLSSFADRSYPELEILESRRD